jgi:hypothetical protein
MKIWRQLLCTVLVCLLAGCAQPRIDTTSEEALKVSLQEVRESLSDADRAEFDSIISQATIGAAMASALSGGQQGMAQVLEPINGLTGPEAIAKFKAIQDARAAKDREAAAKRLSELEQQEREAAAELKRLESLTLVGFRVVEVGSNFMKSQRVFGTVTNTLDVPLARVHFNYALLTPGRAIPWDKGEGVFVIDGGLEPGETRELQSYGGGMYGFASLARAIKEHPDAELGASITDADGADEKTILKARALDDMERAELTRLREKQKS